MMSNKMDNSMTAILSILMIGLGFINGMIAENLLSKSAEQTLRRELLTEKQKLERLQDTINDLQDDLEELRVENEQIIQSLETIVGRSRHLPPPVGPLERAVAVVGPREDDVSCPTSPDANPSCMD